MTKPRKQSEKRPECDGCKHWDITDGVPLSYDMPACSYETETLPNGETILKRGAPEIKIQDFSKKVHQERCGHPFDCGHNCAGMPYVLCEACPCQNDGRCMAPSDTRQSLEFYRGDYICPRIACPLTVIYLRGAEWRPEVRYFPKEL